MDCKKCYLSAVCNRTTETDCKRYINRRHIVQLPCKEGDSMYVLQKQADGITRVVKMSIIKIEPFGAIYNASLYNMLLASNNAFAYRAFTDIDKTVFFSLKKAKAERDFINQFEQKGFKSKR